jgi:hypothetical protein
MMTDCHFHAMLAIPGFDDFEAGYRQQVTNVSPIKQIVINQQNFSTHNSFPCISRRLEDRMRTSMADELKWPSELARESQKICCEPIRAELSSRTWLFGCSIGGF